MYQILDDVVIDTEIFQGTRQEQIDKITNFLKKNRHLLIKTSKNSFINRLEATLNHLHNHIQRTR